MPVLHPNLRYFSWVQVTFQKTLYSRKVSHMHGVSSWLAKCWYLRTEVALSPLTFHKKRVSGLGDINLLLCKNSQSGAGVKWGSEPLTWSFPLALLRNSSTASTACWNRFPLLILIISSLCAWYGFSCSTLIQALAGNTHRGGGDPHTYARKYQRLHRSTMQIFICFKRTLK